MRKNNKKIFLSQQTLTRMLNLRRAGFSYNVLAVMFNCDRTSIAFQADRYQIKPEEVINFKGIVSKFLPKAEPPKYKYVNGERFVI